MLDIDGKDSQAKTFYTVTLAGRLDSRTAHDFEYFQEELLRTGRVFLVLDARSLEYVSSAGIAALLALLRRLEGRGAAVMLQPNREVRMLLGFFGLDELLPIVDTESEARSQLAAEAERLRPELSFEAEEGGRLEAQPAPDDDRVGPARKGPAPQAAGKPIPPRPQPHASRGRPASPQALTESELPELPASSRSVLETTARPLDDPGLRDAIRADLREVLGEVLSELAEGGALPDRSDRFAGGTRTLKKGASHRGLAHAEVINCERCGGRFRVRTAGRHLCPHCRIEVRVSGNGAVHFVEDSHG